MAVRTGKRWALVAMAAGVVVFGVTVLLLAGPIQEFYFVWRLGSRDAPAALAAARWLGEHGSASGARGLIEALRRETGLGDTAVVAVGHILPKIAPRHRVEIVRGLFDVLRDSRAGMGDKRREGLNYSVLTGVLYGIDRAWREVWPAFFEALGHDATSVEAAECLSRSWPDCRGAVSEFIERAELGDVVRLCSAFHQLLWTTNWSESEMPEAYRAIPSSLALQSARPEVRGLALSFSVWKRRNEHGDVYQPAVLKDAYFNDPHPLVKQAAIRITGFLQRSDGGLDLSELLFTEKDPRLLREVIQARTVWLARPRAEDIRLWDGFDCNWLNYSSDDTFPLSAREQERLRDLLGSTQDSDLRDAASMALALSPEGSPPPSRLAGLKVHEWGVWRERGGSLFSEEKLLAGLPAFVHRSTVSAEDIWRHRYVAPPGISCIPIVYLYSREPAVVDVTVGFRQGRPWTFYPSVTDYVEVRRRIDDEESEPEPRAPLDDGEAISPPWLLKALRETGEDSPLPPELRRCYEAVPWLVTDEGPSRAMNSPWPSTNLDGVGLQWRGLRIGYGEELEGPLRSIDPPTWWSRLREVPAASVAVRGEHEKFLFYDGAVRFTGPVEIRWTDESRSALSLKVRRVEDYPLELDRLHDERKAPPTAFIPVVLLISKAAGEMPRGALLRNLAPGMRGVRVELGRLPLTGDGLRGALDSVLREQGLTAEEARALLLTWQPEFFEASGLRMLTVLPQWLYDFMHPLQIRPLPEELVRVGIVWKECDKLEAGKPADSAPAEPVFEAAGLQTEVKPLLVKEERLSLEPEKPLDHYKSGRLGIEPQDHPALSGDGRRILWGQERSWGQELQLAEVASWTRRSLFSVRKPGELAGHAISAGGDRVAFVVKAGTKTLYVADVASGVLLEVYQSEAWDFDHLRVSDDGRRILLLEVHQPVLLDLERKQALFLTIPGCAYAMTAGLSADGSKAAVEGSPGAREPAGLFLLDFEARTTVRVGPTTIGSEVPGFSSDGRRALLQTKLQIGSSMTLIDLAERRALPIARLETDQVNLPAISSDGKKVFFILYGALWTTDLETGISREAYRAPRLTMTETCISADGKVVLFEGSNHGEGGREGLYFATVPY